VSEWIWLDEQVALAVHERALTVHGGADGVKDVGLLESALARPKNVSVYVENADVIDLAAAYTAGVVKGHPFIDGNKRTGFVLGVLFLELNGVRFIASEEAAAQAVLALAAGALDDAGYAAFLRENTLADGAARS
jgi:death-on-curing protein